MRAEADARSPDMPVIQANRPVLPATRPHPLPTILPQTVLPDAAPARDSVARAGLMHLVASLVDATLPRLEGQGDIWTLALHTDPDISRLAISADTRSNSDEIVSLSNAFARVHIRQEIADGKTGSAQLWQANAGRNLSLSDFALLELCTVPIPDPLCPGAVPGPDFYRDLAAGLMAHEDTLRARCPTPGLLFAAATKEAPLGLMWSAA